MYEWNASGRSRDRSVRTASNVRALRLEDVANAVDEAPVRKLHTSAHVHTQTNIHAIRCSTEHAIPCRRRRASCFVTAFCTRGERRGSTERERVMDGRRARVNGTYFTKSNGMPREDAQKPACVTGGARNVQTVGVRRECDGDTSDGRGAEGHRGAFAELTHTHTHTSLSSVPSWRLRIV